jgi:formamidopyrimidine-DNA glycosylase
VTFSLVEAVRIADQLARELRGKAVSGGHLLPRAEVLRRNGFVNVTDQAFAAAVIGKRVGTTTAEGLWLNMPLSPGTHLLLGEGVGSLRYHPPGAAASTEKAHLRLDFDDGSFLVEAVAGMGFIRIAPVRKWRAERYPGVLGVSPLDEERFTPATLASALRVNGRKPVRVALIDQREIAGLTNAYVNDICFEAGLHPARRAADLTDSELAGLHASIVSVLHTAAQQGGDVGQQDIYGMPGNYLFKLGRHRLGQPCPRCHSPIQKIKVGAASSYVCLTCQPMVVH